MFDAKRWIDEINELHAAMKIKKEDVWGEYDHEQHKRISDGMIVARTDEICPIFGDKVPYKSVTVVCNKDDYKDVCYWLGFVHGGDNISQEKELEDGRIAIRSNYMCW